jgi:hypothetical protein
MPAPEAVSQGNGTSDSGADGDEQHAVWSFLCPLLELGHSGAIHVIVDYAGHAQPFRYEIGQWYVEPPIEHDAPTYHASREIHLTGKADAGRIEWAESLPQLARSFNH